MATKELRGGKAPGKKTNLQSVDGGKKDGPTHDEIRKKLVESRNNLEAQYWEFSDLLFEAFDGALYKAWGFSNWKEYVENELDFKMRKVEQLISTAKWFRRMPQKVQDWARAIGPSKLRLILTSVTPENAAEWKKRIEGKSFREIEDIVRDSDSGGNGGGSDPDETEDPNKAKTMSFKLFPKQHKNVEQAVSVAKGMAESEKPGHALDLICTDFLASNGGIETVQDYLKRIEKATGVRIIAYDMSEDAVVFGGMLLDELDKKVKAKAKAGK